MDYRFFQIQKGSIKHLKTRRSKGPSVIFDDYPEGTFYVKDDANESSLNMMGIRHTQVSPVICTVRGGTIFLSQKGDPVFIDRNMYSVCAEIFGQEVRGSLYVSLRQNLIDEGLMQVLKTIQQHLEGKE